MYCSYYEVATYINQNQCDRMTEVQCWKFRTVSMFYRTVWSECLTSNFQYGLNIMNVQYEHSDWSDNARNIEHWDFFVIVNPRDIQSLDPSDIDQSTVTVKSTGQQVHKSRRSSLKKVFMRYFIIYILILSVFLVYQCNILYVLWSC